jgi:hypothetical protein
MASVICKCGKVLEMRVKLVGLSPAITIHDENGFELKTCPHCSRDVREMKEEVIGIQTLIQRWGPGARRSKKEI